MGTDCCDDSYLIYGCSRALKETHIKRRLAYSTISNLSYILFGVTIMTPLGLLGALSHMIFHAIMKICCFFCAGAIIYKTEKNYIHELNGLGKKMPWTFGIFTIASLALMGVPGLCGFISKWNLANAAIVSDNDLAYIGVGALLVSALLTAIYMLSIVIRAFFMSNEQPDEDDVNERIIVKKENIKDPNWLMRFPLVLFVLAMVIFGLCSTPITGFLIRVTEGVY